MGVKAHRCADVGVAGDEVDHRAHLGLAGRVWTGAGLLELLPPHRREVAVQVQALEVGVDLDLQAVVIRQRAFGHHAPVVATELAGLARDHQPGVLRVALPATVRVGQAHVQHPAVAVDVLGGQALDRRLVVGVRPGRRADMARLVGQRQLGAVRVEPRAEVDHPGVEQLGDAGVAAVARCQLVQPVQAGGGGGQLGGVDVAVDPDRRLVGVSAGGGIGQHQQPDVAALEALADRAQLHQGWPRSCVRLQQLRQLSVAIEGIEARGRQRGGLGHDGPA